MARPTAEGDSRHAGPVRPTLQGATATRTNADADRLTRPVMVTTAPTTLAPSSVRALQRSAGNRATTAVVARMIEPVQRECGGGACSCQDCAGPGDAEQEIAAG